MFGLDRLLDEDGILAIGLTGAGGESATLRFASYLAYRKLDEGDALKAIADVAESSQLGRSFYRVEGSDFLVWFVAQSYGVHARKPLIHFVIMTINDIIDVICLEEPEFVA